MTKLKLKPEQLKPIAELIEKLNGDTDRIVIEKAYPFDSELILYVTDRFQYITGTNRISINPSGVADVVDDYGVHPGQEYFWLQKEATNLEKSMVYNRLLDIVLFRAMKSVNNLQVA